MDFDQKGNVSVKKIDKWRVVSIRHVTFAAARKHAPYII
jgi:hypothetical protein